MHLGCGIHLGGNICNRNYRTSGVRGCLSNIISGLRLRGFGILLVFFLQLTNEGSKLRNLGHGGLHLLLQDGFGLSVQKLTTLRNPSSSKDSSITVSQQTLQHHKPAWLHLCADSSTAGAGVAAPGAIRALKSSSALKPWRLFGTSGRSSAWRRGSVAA